MITNKKIGTQFEQEFIRLLANNGWWAHFISPSSGGSQPFDVIAIKGSVVLAADCKTSEADYFRFSRIEDNQRLAFDAMIWKTNARCGFAIKHRGNIYWLKYTDVKVRENFGQKSVKIADLPKFIYDESNS